MHLKKDLSKPLKMTKHLSVKKGLCTSTKRGALPTRIIQLECGLSQMRMKCINYYSSGRELKKKRKKTVAILPSFTCITFEDLKQDDATNQ